MTRLKAVELLDLLKGVGEGIFEYDPHYLEALEMAQKALTNFPRFKVFDTKTGREPSERLLRKIAKENGLIEFDVDQFAICEDGSVILLDDCGKFGYCGTYGLEAMPDVGGG